MDPQGDEPSPQQRMRQPTRRGRGAAHSLEPRRRGGVPRSFNFTLIFTIMYAILSLHKLDLLARNDFQATRQIIPTHPAQKMIDRVIKLHGRSGKASWNIINWDTLNVSHHNKFDCKMVPFESSVFQKQAEICVHTQQDIISEYIKRDKRWMDCNILPALWNESHKFNKDEDHHTPVYLEIGANIGSCVLEMLLDTNAHIIAFEPHPMNLYNLKATITNLGKEYHNRVRVFPVGLGEKNYTETIYAVKGNLGNSGIGKKVKDWERQKWDESLFYTVNIERLGDILNSGKVHIRLAKMDAQGFECNILEGMGAELVSTIDILKFEYEGKFLHAHDCHNLLLRLQDNNFDVFRHFDARAREPFQMSLARNELPASAVDLFAVRHHSNRPMV